MNLHHFRQLHEKLVTALALHTGIEYRLGWDDEIDKPIIATVGFNMNRWSGNRAEDEYLIDHLDDCNTVACLGGHCALLMGHYPKEIEGGGPMYAAIHGFLGIDDQQGQILFRPRHTNGSWNDITAEAAIKALEIIMETEDIPYDLWAQAIRATTPVSNAIDYEPA